MANSVAREPGRHPGRRRLALMVVAVSLALGVAASAYSYLSSSLVIPGPARVLTADELRQGGADRYMGFCGNTFEPRFWPECLGGADDWRTRGASRLVAFCTQQVPSRMFSAADCVSEDRPLFELRGGLRAEDVVTGGTLAAVGLAVMGLLLVASRLSAPRSDRARGSNRG